MNIEILNAKWNINFYINNIHKKNVIPYYFKCLIIIIVILYLLSTIMLPIISSINNNYVLPKTNNYYQNHIKTVNNLITNKPIVNKYNIKIGIVTYISNDQIFSRQIDNNNLQSYITDAKGSTLKLNNSDNKNDTAYNYDAYGKPINVITNKIKQSIPNSFQYNGERFDNNTNLQYLRARFYNPETKRFLNQDSYDLLNRFGYVNGNPIMGVDPSGHDSILNNFFSNIETGFSTAINWVTNLVEKHTAEIASITSSALILTAGLLHAGYSKNTAHFDAATCLKQQYAEGVKNFTRFTESLVGADFSGAVLQNVDFSRLNLTRCNFSGADLSGSIFNSAILVETNFSGATLSATDFSWATFVRTNFKGANLVRSCLASRNLNEANFSGANLSKANFNRTDLRGIDFSGFNLSEASFYLAQLDGTIFKGAILAGANFSGKTDISTADFSDADLQNVFLGETICTNIIITLNTRLESRLIPKRILRVINGVTRNIRAQTRYTALLALKIFAARMKSSGGIFSASRRCDGGVARLIADYI